MTNLFIDVTTDYRPTIDFERVEISGYDTNRSDMKFATRGVGATEDFAGSRRVGGLFGLIPGGNFRLTVKLLNDTGVPIALSSADLVVAPNGPWRFRGRRPGIQVATVVITRPG